MRRAKDFEHLSHKAKKEVLNGFREFRIGTNVPAYKKNEISTTKYNVYNFVFKNLFEQFSKLANVYFLFLAILQCIPQISATGGWPTILMPLMTIVMITMVKDGYEDYKRYKSDQEENNKATHVYDKGTLKEIPWKDIKVGDLVRVNKNESIPVDLLLLASSDFKKGQCFIETKNLDGETNLKAKIISEEMKSQMKSEADILHFSDSILNAEGPNQYLYTFKGSFIYNETKYPLSGQNLILRGCILRNTDFIIGCAVYTG